MNLLYGTYNPSKVRTMKKMLDGLNIRIQGLGELEESLTEPDESGDNPLVNARIKASAYFRQLNKPVFSCDSGLYFENVEPVDQPGVHIKRIHGQNLKDNEFIAYYSRLAAKYGGRLTAFYKNSICLILDENKIYSFDGKSIQSEKFYLADRPHKIYKEGFPLDSLSVHIKTGQYYYDMNQSKNDDWGIVEGFRNFFKESLF